jgi:LysR family transcriptional regulator for bpeEF and oprC
VDLIQEGVDCAIRVGELDDSSLVARRLKSLTMATVASPLYIEKYGEPRSLEELENHSAVQYVSSRTGRTVDFNFAKDKDVVEIKMRGSLAVNDADAYVMCGVNGAGIIQAPLFMIATHLANGELKKILTPWNVRSLPLSVIFPHHRYMPQKVRVFVEWVASVIE